MFHRKVIGRKLHQPTRVTNTLANLMVAPGGSHVASCSWPSPVPQTDCWHQSCRERRKLHQPTRVTNTLANLMVAPGGSHVASCSWPSPVPQTDCWHHSLGSPKTLTACASADSATCSPRPRESLRHRP